MEVYSLQMVHDIEAQLSEVAKPAVAHGKHSPNLQAIMMTESEMRSGSTSTSSSDISSFSLSSKTSSGSSWGSKRFTKAGASHKVWRDYSLVKEIGRGKFGVVYKAQSKATKEEVAVKSILKKHMGGSAEEVVKFLDTEISIAQELSMSSRNVVGLKAIYEDTRHIHLVMELCDGGDLYEYTKRGGHSGLMHNASSERKVLLATEGETSSEGRRRAARMKEQEAAWILLQVAQALSVCHEHGVVHRDVKPENILIGNTEPKNQVQKQAAAADEGKKGSLWRRLKAAVLPGRGLAVGRQEGKKDNGSVLSCAKPQTLSSRIAPEESALDLIRELSAASLPEGAVVAKLADFGLSQRIEEGQALQGAVGSPAFMAPEVVRGNAYSFPADVWSLGVVLFITLSAGDFPYEARTTQLIMRKIAKATTPIMRPAQWLGVTSEAKEVVRTLLAANPEGRPTAAEVAKMPWVVENAQKWVNHLKEM